MANSTQCCRRTSTLLHTPFFIIPQQQIQERGRHKKDEANSNGGAVAVHREWLGRRRAVLGGKDED
eukprot:3625578-Ditylum_brightwellii.AAC.1